MNRNPKRVSPFSTNSTISSTSTFDNPSFGIEEFKIIPIVTPDINAQQGQTPDPTEAQDAPVIDFQQIKYTEEDLCVLTRTFWDTLPRTIWPKLPSPEKDHLKTFNHELYLYCLRKGIDPRDYLFDEFGLIVSGLTLGSFHYQNYQSIYGKKIEYKEDKDLSKDYDHVKEVEEKNKDNNEPI